MTLAPIDIKPHLVAFFFKEGKGKEVGFGNKKVKPVIFSKTSSLTRLIRTLMVKCDQPVEVDHFNVFLTVNENASKKYTGTIYKQVSGTNSFLKLPQDANRDINDLLEDIFSMALVSYINGAVENSNDSAEIRAAINKFMDKYDLLELGFNTEMIRRSYYRHRDKPAAGHFQ